MLLRKMLRDLGENKGAYIACIIVIVIGLMTFSSFSMAIRNLKLSQEDFYTEETFADGFANVRSMPAEKIKKLGNIEGIQDIQGRIVHDVRVTEVSGGGDTGGKEVYLRLISLDFANVSIINNFRLLQGSALETNKLNIWLDNKFFEANAMSLNDEIKVIIDGKEKTLLVAGVGMSPEFVYALRTESDMFPDPEKFGIAFAPLEVMESLFPGKGAVNNIVFTLKPGLAYEDVKEPLEHELKPYGLERIYPRTDQVSHIMLDLEIRNVEAVARIMPLIFLSIAGIILFIMLKRLTEQQRGQIGILKAFGYTSKEIMLHYISYAAVVGLVGGFFGGVLGIFLSVPLTNLYRVFFNLPDVGDQFYPVYVVLSILISLCFSLLAGYLGCKGVLELEPAEAMRPRAPMVGKRTSLEKIGFFWEMLTTQGKMSLRNIARNKGRSVFIFLGVMFSFALLAFTWSMNDMVQIMLFDQYEKVETYDLKVTFSRPLGQMETQRELSMFPGVGTVEPMIELPVTLKNNWLKKDVILLGLTRTGSMFNILDNNNKKVDLPSNGVLLSERLAGLLDAELGTYLYAENLATVDSAGKDKRIEVVGIIPQYLGMNAYMEINSLQDLLEGEKLATSMLLNIDEQNVPLLRDKYKHSDLVQSMEIKEARLRQSQDLMDSYGSMIYIFALIGVVISFAIIYNSSIVSLSERSQELASMKVLGMSSSEVLSVVTFEQWFISFWAVLVGIPFSKILSTGMSQVISNDLFTMPTTITVTSFLTALFVTAVSIVAAQQVAARRIRQLNLAETLKLLE